MLPHHRCCLALVALATAPVAAQTVSLRANDGAHLAALIVEAERLGAEYPRFDPAAPAVEGAPVLRTKERPATPRTCVRASLPGPVRSGEFEIGGGLLPRWQPEGPKIWWSPTHHGRDLPLLVLTATNTSDPNQVVTTDPWGLAYGTPMPVVPVPEEERNYFFPTWVPFPGPGQWLVVGTAGPNWGCVVLTILPSA